MENIDIQNLVGQAFGVIALFFSCRRYFKKKRTEIMKLSLIAYLCYIAHYFLIGAFAGAYTLIIAICRDSYIYQREKHHKKHRNRFLYNNFLVFILLVLVYGSFIILNINNPTNILPLTAGLTYLCFEWFTSNKTTLKFAGGLTTLPWLFYDIFSFSVPAMITDTIGIISSGLGILKDKKLRKHKVKHNH